MDYESLFAQTRWQILGILAEQPLSPLELAQKINSTISHVSQQLKFLEATGLVKKQKIVNRDKGKPRMAFSLAGDFVHLSLLIKGLAQKRLLTLTEHHKAILKIWMLENARIHKHVERFYWDAEEHLPEIKALAADWMGNLYIVVDDQDKMKSRLASLVKKHTKDGLSCTLLNEKGFLRIYNPGQFSVFYGDFMIPMIKEVEK